jgi:hypothetical protein
MTSTRQQSLILELLKNYSDFQIKIVRPQYSISIPSFPALNLVLSAKLFKYSDSNILYYSNNNIIDFDDNL